MKLTVHNLLSALGLSLVDKRATMGRYRHHGADMTVQVGQGRPIVTVGGQEFFAASTVGDVRHLLRLRGVTVPGVPAVKPATDEQRNDEQEEETAWRGRDAIRLVYDFGAIA